jgi:hypothetical protein
MLVDMPRSAFYGVLLFVVSFWGSVAWMIWRLVW